MYLPASLLPALNEWETKEGDGFIETRITGGCETPVWVLEPEPRSSARTVGVLSHWAISSTHLHFCKTIGPKDRFAEDKEELQIGELYTQLQVEGIEKLPLRT